ncbi:MAG: hypothetical protein ACNA8W_25800, partial [Bradymonadaceae bacterium]
MDETTFVIRAAQALTMPETSEALRSYDPQSDLEARDAEIIGLIEDACIFVEKGKIAFVGPWSDRPKPARSNKLPHFDTGVVTPGLIDCHTHAVFAGERSAEFVLRNAGRPYVEILEAGGGILNTVDAVRRTSLDELAESLLGRIYES